MCTIYIHYDIAPVYVPSLIHPAIWALVYIYCHVDARCVARGRGGVLAALSALATAQFESASCQMDLIYIYIMGLIRVHNLGAVFTLRVAWVLLVRLVHLVLFYCVAADRAFASWPSCVRLLASPLCA